jgi:hypothetical protein
LRAFGYRGDFSKFLLANIPAKDRAEMAPILKDARLPDVRRDGNDFIFSDGISAITLSWPSFPEKKFVINGMPWEYKAATPLKSQLVLLLKRLSLKEQSASKPFLRLLEPRAEAMTQVAMILLSAVAGWALVQAERVGVYGSCYYLESKGTAEQWDLCNSFVSDRLVRTESLRLKQTVKVEVDAKKTIDANEDSTFWNPGWNRQCPTDKTKNVYVADIQPIQMAGGKATTYGDWSTIRIDLQEDGTKAKSGFTAPAGTDMNAPEAVGKATNSFKFDENGLLKTFDTPNPNYKPGDPASKPTVTIEMSATDTTLEPDMRARRDQVKSMLKSVSSLLNACVTKAQQKKIQEQQQQTQSPGPSEQPSTTAPVAPSPATTNAPAGAAQ